MGLYVILTFYQNQLNKLPVIATMVQKDIAESLLLIGVTTHYMYVLLIVAVPG